MTRKMERLAKEVTERTGIDFEKYKDEDVIEQLKNITSFIISPASVIPTIIKPLLYIIITSNLIVVSYFILVEVNILGALIFFVIGNIINTLIGITVGVRFSVRNLLTDVKSVIGYAINVSRCVLEDCTNMASCSIKRPDVGDVFQGVSYVVITPSVEKIIHDKFFFLSRPISFIVSSGIYYFTKNLSNYASKFVKEDNENGKQEGTGAHTKSGDSQNRGAASAASLINVLEVLKKRIEAASSFVIPKVLFPTNLIIYILVMLYSILMLVFYQLFA